MRAGTKFTRDWATVLLERFTKVPPIKLNCSVVEKKKTGEFFAAKIVSKINKSLFYQ